jgi:tetratricopeptide (TPR) repeat protein
VDEPSAVALVARARSEPSAGYAQLRAAVDEEQSDDVLSVLLKGLGDVARWVATVEESAEYLERSIAHAHSAGRDDLVGWALLTMSSTRLLAGDTSAAMDALEEAARIPGEHLQAQVEFQRGAILGREGHAEEALAAFDRALPIFEKVGDQYFAAGTRGNRALVRLERGEARSTRADLIAAREGFRAGGHAASVAWMTHNLGRVSGRLGDVPGALRHFRESERALRRLNIDPSEVQFNRAEVLLQAGLYGEAEEVATEAARSMAGRGLELDRAEALFAKSQALLGQLRYGQAASAAAEAAALLANQGRVPWALRAELVSMQGDRIVDNMIAERCSQIAEQLSSLGQVLAAAQAYALVARYDAKAAQAGLDGLSLRLAEVPLEHRLTALDVLARARIARGDRRGALHATRLAIDLANRHRLLRGAADLRAAVSAQMDSIAQLGLTLRRDANRATAVLHWVDRCHDGTLRATEMLLDDVPERGDLLAELRSSQQRLRTADAADAPALMSQQAQLQRRLIAADRRVGGRAVRPGQLPRALGHNLREVVVLQYHRHGTRLGAVVVVDGHARLVELGALDEIERGVELLRRAVRRLAQSQASGLGDERSLEAVRRHASTLEALIVPEIGRAPTSDESIASPLVIVPLTHHIGIPWSVLPNLSRRPITVAPSLRHWVMYATDERKPITTVALVEGVQLLGTTEIDALADVWAKVAPRVIRGATVDDTIDAMRSVQLIHLACHGGRRTRDGRFAQLRLADGDLVSFELERLAHTPRVVAMAACEAGLLEPLPGDESAGLARALFSATTATVIAPVVVVPDNSLTREVFVDFHRSLADGVTPAAALFAAQSHRADDVESMLARSVNCFGWG